MSTGLLVRVVEDEPQMRRFLRASLTAHGFALVEAATAQEGTALATSHNPELILLDLGLPDEDGIQVTRRIREWSHVPARPPPRARVGRCSWPGISFHLFGLRRDRWRLVQGGQRDPK